MSSQDGKFKEDRNMITGAERTPVRQADVTVTILVSTADRINVWRQVLEQDLFGRYLGDNKFSFDQSQLQILHSAGVQFQAL